MYSRSSTPILNRIFPSGCFNNFTVTKKKLLNFYNNDCHQELSISINIWKQMELNIMMSTIASLKELGPDYHNKSSVPTLYKCCSKNCVDE